MIYWMTGLSGAGKSTLARYAADRCQVRVLDGDELRKGLCAGLGFSEKGRIENLRRVAHLARFLNEYTDVIVACITPYEKTRKAARKICGSENWRLVYVEASIEEAIRRDPKGLYDMVAAGALHGFTGVSDPFDEPEGPDLVLNTEEGGIRECGDRLTGYIRGDDTLWALFIGRWQPLHNGHVAILRAALDEGRRVAVGVRDVRISASDPYSMAVRLRMLNETFEVEARAGRFRAFPVCDIASVHVGRGVGYKVVQYDMPEGVEGISATEIRARIMRRDRSWRGLVPKAVARLLKDAG